MGMAKWYPLVFTLWAQFEAKAWILKRALLQQERDGRMKIPLLWLTETSDVRGQQPKYLQNETSPQLAAFLSAVLGEVQELGSSHRRHFGFPLSVVQEVAPQHGLTRETHRCMQPSTSVLVVCSAKLPESSSRGSLVCADQRQNNYLRCLHKRDIFNVVIHQIILNLQTQFKCSYTWLIQSI